MYDINFRGVSTKKFMPILEVPLHMLITSQDKPPKPLELLHTAEKRNKTEIKTDLGILKINNPWTKKSTKPGVSHSYQKNLEGKGLSNFPLNISTLQKFAFVVFSHQRQLGHYFTFLQNIFETSISRLATTQRSTSKKPWARISHVQRGAIIMGTSSGLQRQSGLDWNSRIGRSAPKYLRKEILRRALFFSRALVLGIAIGTNASTGYLSILQYTTHHHTLCPLWLLALGSFRSLHLLTDNQLPQKWSQLLIFHRHL